MKTRLSFMLTYFCISIVVDAQNTMPPSGPSFSIPDTTQSSSVSSSSDYARTVGYNAIASTDQTSIYSKPSRNSITFEPDPISDWSNPPGFMGYNKGDIILGQKKSLSAKKYQRMKKGRCYYF